MKMKQYSICGPTNENEAILVYVDPLMKMKQY